MNIKELKFILDDTRLKNIISIDSLQCINFKQNKFLLDSFIKDYNYFNKSELIYLLRNKDHLENLHIFCKCGNKNIFKNKNIGYTNHCSRKCSANDNEIKRKRYNTLKNDIDENGLNGFQRQQAKSRIKKLLKYNDPNYNNSAKMVRTKRSNIDSNGLDSFQRGTIKMVKTRKSIEDNGLDSFHNAGLKGKEKRLNDIDNFGRNSYDRQVLKTKQINIEQFGVDNYSKTEAYKNKFKDSLYVEKIVKKRYNTMKKNKSFNRRSKSEIRCFELLKTKFPDVEHSYYNKERYPFNCDMYVPSQDLFIECHFGFAHGGEPFDPNNIEHLQEIEKCKIKQKEFRFDGKKKDGYAEKIKVWTISDPKKLKTFQENDLNYKIFYTEVQFRNWFNNI